MELLHSLDRMAVLWVVKLPNEYSYIANVVR